MKIATDLLQITAAIEEDSLVLISVPKVVGILPSIEVIEVDVPIEVRARINLLERRGK